MVVAHTISEGVALATKAFQVGLSNDTNEYLTNLYETAEDLILETEEKARANIISLPRVDTGRMRDNVIGFTESLPNNGIRMILEDSVTDNPKSKNADGEFVDYVSYQEYGADGIFGIDGLNIAPGLFMTNAMAELEDKLGSEINKVFMRTFK